MTPKSSVPTVQPIVGESDTEDIARQRRRFVRGERGDWGEEKGHGSYKWMIYSGVGIVLLIILTVVLSQKFGRKPVRESQKSQFSQMDVFDDTPGEKDADPEMLEMLSTSQTEAKEIYGKYATAKSAEDLTGLLFNESIVMPLLSSRWEPLNARSGWAPGDEATWTVLDREGEHYGVLEGSNDDYTPFYAFFRKDGDSLKLDWKATTGYGSAEFAEMKKAQGDGTEIRNVISQGDFYTFSLPEEKYRSLRMMSPDGNFTLWAYTERESELDEKLIKLFTPSQITGEAQSQIQVILSVVPGPDESLPNQWVIKDLVRMNWLDK